MACCIHACAIHSVTLGDSLPCIIRLKMVDVVIEKKRAMLVADKRILCSYEVDIPFTEDQLSVLNWIESTDPSVYIRELKRVTRSKCGVHACTAHKMGDMTQPCRIPIQGNVFQGELVIEPQTVSFRSDTQTLHLYESPQPFTRENLLKLNDFDSQEPADYVRALKYATKMSHCTFIPIRTGDSIQLGRSTWGRRSDVRYPWNSPTPG
jgi:hypothetical protein